MRLLQVCVTAAGVALVAACGSTSGDTTTTSTENGDDGDVREIPARILGEDISAGQPWTTSRLTTPSEVELLIPSGADVDWDSEVVFAYTLAESGSCPFGAVERIVYDEPHEVLYPVVPLAEDFDACTDDANPHTVVVAIDRGDLPTGRFSIWVNGDDPPSGVAEGITHFAPGELDSGDQESEFDALGADGELAVGETRIAYDVTTHCGLNRIFRDVDGRAWVLNDADASPENMDYVPEQWRGAVTGEAIDLQIERAEEDVLLVTAVGTEHTMRYEPADDEVGCA